MFDSYSGGEDRRLLIDVHFVDLENFQPPARFKVQKFAEVTKFVLGFKCDSSAPQTVFLSFEQTREPMNFLDARQSVLIYLLTSFLVSWTLFQV